MGIVEPSSEACFESYVNHVCHTKMAYWCSLCCYFCLVAQLCPTLCDHVDYSPPGSSVHGMDSPGKNTGVGCRFLLPWMLISHFWNGRYKSVPSICYKWLWDQTRAWWSIMKSCWNARMEWGESQKRRCLSSPKWRCFFKSVTANLSTCLSPQMSVPCLFLWVLWLSETSSSCHSPSNSFFSKHRVQK